jgi:hypothetical protein
MAPECQARGKWAQFRARGLGRKLAGRSLTWRAFPYDGPQPSLILTLSFTRPSTSAGVGQPAIPPPEPLPPQESHDAPAAPPVLPGPGLALAVRAAQSLPLADAPLPAALPRRAPLGAAPTRLPSPQPRLPLESRATSHDRTRGPRAPPPSS